MRPLDTDGLGIFIDVVHPRISTWIRVGKLKFTGLVSPSMPDDLDPIIFKVWGLEYGPHGRDTPWGKWTTFDLAWLTSDHALTLFKAKCAKAGVTDFEQGGQNDASVHQE